MYPGRPHQNQGPGGPPMVQYPGVYYKSTPPAASQWPPMQTPPSSAAPASNYVQYPSKYTATSSAHSATRSALAESYERIRNEMRGLKGESKSSYQPTPPPPSLKQKNDPLTSLCSNTSVSLSSLLEAAMAPNAGSSKRTTEDPIMKKTILGKCERKIAQLYRDRITGMGSFFPLIEANTTAVVDTNDLLRHCPRLEFNSDPVGSPWICPDITIDRKKPDPPKPEVVLPQTIETVESSALMQANILDTSLPPPGMEPENIELLEPSVNLITDMTFEKWADGEREKRQREREHQWEQLMLMTGLGRRSKEREEQRKVKRNRRSRSRSWEKSRSRSRSKSRRRRSPSSRSRIRHRSRKRSRSRSRRHRSSSLSLSLSPRPHRRRESCKSPDSPPTRQRCTPQRERSIRGLPNEISQAPLWPGQYSALSLHPSSLPYGLPDYGAPIEHSNQPSNYLVPRHPSWPYHQPGMGMPLGPYGPQPAYPYRAPGLRPPGMRPWPGSLPGLPYRMPPPRGLCAAPNMITIGDPPVPGGGPSKHSAPEVIVIDDCDNSTPNSPTYPPGLSPEMQTTSNPSGNTDCLRMRCFSHLSRIQKVHENLHHLQRESAELRDTIYDMEAENREFQGLYAMINGFLCKMEINTDRNPGAAFKVMLPSSGIKSILWDIHGAYHNYTKEELLSLFDDLFYNSRNVSKMLLSVLEKCARCVSIKRQKEREGAGIHSRHRGSVRERRSHENKSRERDHRHRHRENIDRSRRRSRESSRKSHTPGKHSKERSIRSSSNKSRSVQSKARKSRSPRHHSEDRKGHSTSRKSRSPRKHLKETKDCDKSRRSRSSEKRSDNHGDREALKKSSPGLKSPNEKSEEKSVKKSNTKSPEEKRDDANHSENDVTDDSSPTKGSKLDKEIEKTEESSTPDVADLPKADQPPIITASKEVLNQEPKVKIATTQRLEPNKPEAKVNADSRSNKAEDFKTRVRQVQTTVESLKKMIEDLEGPNRKTDEPMLLMKAGMLCRRMTINEKAEIKIVVSPEILPDIIQIVHTMAPVHAPAQKTVVVYQKHFTPMDDIDAVVADVLDSCDTCKHK